MKKPLLLFLILFAHLKVFANTAADYDAAGQKLYANKDYPKAIQYFTAAVKLDPNDAQARLGLGNCFYSEKRYSSALINYKKAQELQPQSTQMTQFIQALQAKLDSIPRSIEWRTPSEGLAESTRTGKPILYDVSAEWCGYCKLLNEQVFKDPDCAARINLMFVPVRVIDRAREEGRNPEDIAGIEKQYKSNVFPTLVVQFPNKSDFKKFVGFGGKKKTMAFLNRAVE